MSDATASLLNPLGVHSPIGAYSHVARATSGTTLYLAGQVGIDAAGNLVGDGGAREQTLQTFRNIGQVLKGAGASWANVVQFTTYLVGRASVEPFLEARREAFAEVYPDGAYPPNTLVLVAGLVREELLVEASAIATIP